jgi:hypothetical protein
VLTVDIRWRPTGGRGEYEHVPQSVLLGRNVIIDPISVPGARIATDVWGRIKDGKPRLRRERPNDRSILNVHTLIAALALLPDPIRQDQGRLILPLEENRYVISQISFTVNYLDNEHVICTPRRLRVLHDSNEIDLIDRLMRIAEFLSRTDLEPQVRSVAGRYVHLVRGGIPSVEIRSVADALMAWFRQHPDESEIIEAPSDEFISETQPTGAEDVELATLSVDETKRRLVSHYRIDRNQHIRRAKIQIFKGTHGQVFCENCTFNFETGYGQRGKDFIEVHHLLPLAALLPNSITKLADLMLLCSNCHRIVHRRKPLLSADALHQITRFRPAPLA